MHNPSYRLFYLLMIASLLNACAPFRPNTTRAGYCNEMNSRIIFGGSTANPIQAQNEMAEQPLLQHTFDNNCT